MQKADVALILVKLCQSLSHLNEEHPAYLPILEARDKARILLDNQLTIEELRAEIQRLR